MSAEEIGIIAGIVSVILAFVAIWQAMFFYTKGKDTERKTGGQFYTLYYL